MKKETKKRRVSTFDRIMTDKKRQVKFEKGYEKFLLSELLSEAMEEKEITVRKLAKDSGVSAI
jgi:hypothetical protein